MEEQKEKIIRTLATMLDYLGLEATLRIEEKNNKLAVKIASEEAGRIIGRKGQTLDSLQRLINLMMYKGDDDCPHIVLDIDGYGARPARGEGEESSAEGRGDDRRERRDRGGRGRDRGDRGDRGGRGGDRGERGGDRGDRGGDRERGERGEHSGMTKEQLEQQALDAAKEVKKWGDAVILPKMNAHDRRIIHVTLKDDTEVETASEGDGALKKVVISLKKSE